MLTKQKSEDLGLEIMNLKLMIECMDFDYIAQVIVEMKEHHSFSSSLGFIAPNYVPEKADVIKKQVEALEILVSYKQKLDEIVALKNVASKAEASKMKLNDLFF